METLIHLDGVELDGTSNRLLKNKTKQIARYAERHGRGSMSLDVRLAEAGGGQTSVDLDLSVDGTHFHVRKTDVDVHRAIKHATAAMSRQFDKLRVRENAKLRSRAEYRRKRFFNDQLSWQQYLDNVVAEPSLNELIEDELPRLKFIATSELAHHIGNGDIEPGAIDPLEVIDDVIAQDFKDLENNSPGEFRSRLINDLMTRMAAAVADWQHDRDQNVSTDLDVPEIEERLALSYLGDEVLDFWIPEEDLLLEDVTKDPGSKNPEEVIANKELRQWLFSALTKLPREHRVTFAGAIMDEEKIEDLAQYLDRDVEYAAQILSEAKAMLVDRLSEKGQPMANEEMVNLYSSLGKTFQVDLNNLMRMH